MSIVDILGNVPAASIHAYLDTADQSITTSTWTNVAFNADTDKYKISRTAETITIDHDGWYDITIQIAFDASNLGVRVARLYVNGTTEYLRDNEQGIGIGEPDSSQFLLLSGYRKFAEGDTLKIQFWHNKGSDLDIIYGQNKTFFILIKMR